MSSLVMEPNCEPWCIFELSLSAAAAALWQEILWSICHCKCRKTKQPECVCYRKRQSSESLCICGEVAGE